jgi:hypothetical protein
MTEEKILPLIKSIIEKETGRTWSNIDINNITHIKGHFLKFYNIAYSYDGYPGDDMIYMGNKFLSEKQIIEFSRNIKLNELGI